MDILTRSSLDKTSCSHIHEDGEQCDSKGNFNFIAACHPHQGLNIHYVKGILAVSCHICEQTVCLVEVSIL